MKELWLYGNDIAYVDDDVFLWADMYRWRRSGYGRKPYVSRIGTKADGERNRKTIYLHREIMNPKEGEQVDHIDGDTFNLVRSNLRCCTPHQNSCGRSRCSSKNSKIPYKGVYLTKHNTFMAQITVKKCKIQLGTHKTMIEAANAYNKAAEKYFGEFAVLNSVQGE